VTPTVEKIRHLKQEARVALEHLSKK